MTTVFLVESIYSIENYYRASQAVKVFAKGELANDWVERRLANDRALRAAKAHADKIRAEWGAAHPFVWEEPEPPAVDRWPQGLSGKAITTAMRETRAAQKQAWLDYLDRERAARAERDQLEDAHLREVWDLPLSLEEVENVSAYSEPLEYTITEMPLEEGE